jgi:uncharacterized protein YyaL (SSP411 family)
MSHPEAKDTAMPRFRPLPTLAHTGLGIGLTLTLILSTSATTPAAAADDKAPANRLARETSPYLLLHAHNPVDWYPWGPEALARAKAENRPIFLSVGYSSCYWCHVMERESFMNPAIAKYLNEHFVSIKVDREERPDVDQIYMTALRAFRNGAGWPMSIFLTPDGRPFFGATYFPPEDRDGFEGFLTVLERVDDAWRNHRAELDKVADQVVTIVRRSLAGAGARGRVPLSRDLAAQGRVQLTEQFDPTYGGFGFSPENPRRPKFPEPVNLVFLLDQHRRGAKGPPGSGLDPLAMVVTTLDQMARGGIRDQLAGGYHRYATNRSWTVPHFEKMLYDNAQLAAAHLLAFERTGDVRWRDEAAATFAFLARTMTAPEGGFYSALDAEVGGEEGQSYVWTRGEVARVLGAGADDGVFAAVYGLTLAPNFADGRYVLFEPRSRAAQAEAFGTTPAALEQQLGPLRARLLAGRDRRPAPLRDDKVLTSWNGLTIAAYAEGFRLLRDGAYRQAAERAADFLLTHLRTPEGRLLRTYRSGQSKIPAYLEDYAFLTHGLLRLHAATGDPARLAQARALTDRMIADFADTRDGGFFSTAGDHESLLARPKDLVDGALPSGNSVAIRNLVALAAATGERRYLDLAGQALDAFSATLAETPGALPLMLVALEEYLDARPAAVIAATPGPPPAPADVLPGGQTVVAATAAPAPGAAIVPGGELDVTVTLTVMRGWHIYANPAGDETLKPTTVTLSTGQPATLAAVRYPVGTATLATPGSPEMASIYEGTVKLTACVRLDAQAQPGPLTLNLKVSYQACNDRVCLPPASLIVPVVLTIVR